MAGLIFSTRLLASPPSSSARFILKCIPLPGTIMVEKFTIADGRQKEGRGKREADDRERVEWADRKITGYAPENERERPSEETDTFRTRAECGLRIIARERKGTKEIGPPSSSPSLPPSSLLRSCQSCPTRRVTRRKRQKVTGNFFAPFQSDL